MQSSGSGEGGSMQSVQVHRIAESTLEEFREYIVEHMGDLDAQLHGRPILHVLASRGLRGHVEEVLERAGDSLFRVDNKGRGVLHAACRAGQWALAQMLLERGAADDVVDTGSESVVHLLAAASADAVARQLLFDILRAMTLETAIRLVGLARRSDGAQPLHLAMASFGSSNVVALLMRYGASPVARDFRGRTPAEWAPDVTVARALTSGAIETRQLEIPLPSTVCDRFLVVQYSSGEDLALSSPEFRSPLSEGVRGFPFPPLNDSRGERSPLWDSDPPSKVFNMGGDSMISGSGGGATLPTSGGPPTPTHLNETDAPKSSTPHKRVPMLQLPSHQVRSPPTTNSSLSSSRRTDDETRFWELRDAEAVGGECDVHELLVRRRVVFQQAATRAMLRGQQAETASLAVSAFRLYGLAELLELWLFLYAEGVELPDALASRSQALSGVFCALGAQLTPGCFSHRLLLAVRHQAQLLDDPKVLTQVRDLLQRHGSEAILVLWDFPFDMDDSPLLRSSSLSSALEMGDKGGTGGTDVSSESEATTQSGGGGLGMGVSFLLDDPRQAAEQLTTLMLHLTRNVKPSELLEYADSRRRRTHAANLFYLNDLYNRLTQGVLQATARSPAGSVAAVWTRAVRLAGECRARHNFLALAAVVGALQHHTMGALYGLRTQLLPARELAELDDLIDLLSPKHSFKRYRDCVSRLQEAYVPYIAVTLKKLPLMTESFRPWEEDRLEEEMGKTSSSQHPASGMLPTSSSAELLTPRSSSRLRKARSGSMMDPSVPSSTSSTMGGGSGSVSSRNQGRDSISSPVVVPTSRGVGSQQLNKDYLQFYQALFREIVGPLAAYDGHVPSLSRRQNQLVRALRQELQCLGEEVDHSRALRSLAEALRGGGVSSPHSTIPHQARRRTSISSVPPTARDVLHLDVDGGGEESPVGEEGAAIPHVRSARRGSTKSGGGSGVSGGGNGVRRESSSLLEEHPGILPLALTSGLESPQPLLSNRSGGVEEGGSLSEIRIRPWPEGVSTLASTVRVLTFEDHGMHSVGKERQWVIPLDVLQAAGDMSHIAGSWSGLRPSLFFSPAFVAVGHALADPSSALTPAGGLATALAQLGLGRVLSMSAKEEEGLLRLRIKATTAAPRLLRMAVASASASVVAGWLTSIHPRAASPKPIPYALVKLHASRGEYVVLTSYSRDEVATLLLSKSYRGAKSLAPPSAEWVDDMGTAGIRARPRKTSESEARWGEEGGGAGMVVALRHNGKDCLVPRDAPLCPAEAELRRAPQPPFSAPVAAFDDPATARSGLGARTGEQYVMLPVQAVSVGVQRLTTDVLGLSELRAENLRLGYLYMLGEDLGQAALLRVQLRMEAKAAAQGNSRAILLLVQELTSLAALLGLGKLQLTSNPATLSLDAPMLELELRNSAEVAAWATSRASHSAPICSLACGFVAGFLQLGLRSLAPRSSSSDFRLAASETCCKSMSSAARCCSIVVSPF